MGIMKEIDFGIKNELWTAEDELEFQMGDMNGIAFEDEVPQPEAKPEVKPEE